MTAKTVECLSEIPAHDHWFAPWAHRTAAIYELTRRLEARRSLLSYIQLFQPTYRPGWIHREVTDLLDGFIEAVERGTDPLTANPDTQGPRLMVFLPPGHGKSEIVSRKFPSFVLGRHPEWEVVGVTYGQDLANDFGRAVRNTCIDPLTTDLFPNLLISKDSNAVDKFATASNGAYTAVGVGGPLTGRRAHILIIDDPVKDREAADSETQRQNTWNWYSSVARTRLYPGGGIIVLQTRWHEDDLAGKLLTHAQANPGADQWKTYSFPAIATHDEKHRLAGEALHPERYPIQELNRLRSTLVPRDWSALYQQNPTPDDGNYFPSTSIHTKAVADVPATLNWYVSVDLAIGERTTNDYTVITPFAVTEQFDLIFDDPIRGRFNAFDIVEHILDLAQLKHAQLVGIERGHISKAIGPQLSKRMQERKQYVGLWEYTPTKDKQARARGLQARMQQRKVFFVDTPFFRETGRPELLAFPAGKHDDYVDTASMAALMLEAVCSPTPASLPPAPPPEEGTFEYMRRNNAAASREPTDKHKPQSLFAHRKDKNPVPKQSGNFIIRKFK